MKHILRWKVSLKNSHPLTFTHDERSCDFCQNVFPVDYQFLQFYLFIYLFVLGLQVGARPGGSHLFIGEYNTLPGIHPSREGNPTKPPEGSMSHTYTRNLTV